MLESVLHYGLMFFAAIGLLFVTFIAGGLSYLLYRKWKVYRGQTNKKDPKRPQEPRKDG